MIGGVLLAEHVCGWDVELQCLIVVVDMSDKGVGVELETSELAILGVLPDCGVILLQLTSRVSLLVRGFQPRSTRTY
jgi:hypothetical protein